MTTAITLHSVTEIAVQAPDIFGADALGPGFRTQRFHFTDDMGHRAEITAFIRDASVPTVPAFTPATPPPPPARPLPLPLDPLPWAYRSDGFDGGIVDADGDPTAFYGELHEGYIGEDEAAPVIRAVNAYPALVAERDALLAALRALVEGLDDPAVEIRDPAQGADAYSPLTLAMLAARAALAATKGA